MELLSECCLARGPELKSGQSSHSLKPDRNRRRKRGLKLVNQASIGNLADLLGNDGSLYVFGVLLEVETQPVPPSAGQRPLRTHPELAVYGVGKEVQRLAVPKQACLRCHVGRDRDLDQRAPPLA